MAASTTLQNGEYRISNTELRMTKSEQARPQQAAHIGLRELSLFTSIFDIPCSIFDIRCFVTPTHRPATHQA
jgi:hypothetical protein